VLSVSPLAALVAALALAACCSRCWLPRRALRLAAVSLVLSVGSPLGWLVAKPLWPVSPSQLAVGCCLVLSVSLLSAGHCSCWTLLGCALVLGSARLLGSAGLCVCWAAGLLWAVSWVSAQWRRLCSLSPLLSALAGSLMGDVALLLLSVAAELSLSWHRLSAWLSASAVLRRCAALLAAAKCCCRLDWALLHGCWAAGLLGFWALLPGRRGSVRCLYQSRAVGARRERRAAQAVAQPVPAWLSAESAGLGVGIGGRESVSGLSSTGKDRSGEQADKRTYPGLVSRRQFAKPKARSDATSGSARLPKGQRRQTKPQHENAEHDPNGA